MANKQFSRRRFIGLSTAAAGLIFLPSNSYSASFQAQKKPDSTISGVRIGAITYSWRSMPSEAKDILQYCIDTGISTIELMGDVAERYAGLPQEIGGGKVSKETAAAQKKWRLSAPMEKFRDLRKMYNDAGVQIHIVKFSPGDWSDEEMDYAFRAAKELGTMGITNEIGEEACKRMGPVAEKHGLKAIFHNHLQPGEPGFSFDKFLQYSPANMLNFDAGHYFGATGKHPNEIIEKYHDRIASLHMKDKTGPKGKPPNTNMPWGQGQTPVADILNLLRKKKSHIYADIELEYDVPKDSDAVQEVKKCVDFCRKVLA
ncbi:MAG TPA: sugar phosphate isomerase/epimerase [Bacteroidales bacterium]|nr:sugar phosphate isomerase/epimerase [Bacteroidales bacterium]